MTKTSIGVQELRKRIGHKAKTEPQHRFWGLYTHVWKLDVLREAYRLAKQTHGAPKRNRGWTTWSEGEVYGQWKLYRDYKVSPRSESTLPHPTTAMWQNSVGNAGWRKSPGPV